MASVAATVDTGTFKQPILTAKAKQVTRNAAARRDRRGPQGDDARRRHQRHGGRARLRPDVYAKTGTADIQGQGQPNSWLVAFDPAKDVAVACLVVNAGYGAQFAGPEVGVVPERLLSRCRDRGCTRPPLDRLPALRLRARAK